MIIRSLYWKRIIAAAAVVGALGFAAAAAFSAIATHHRDRQVRLVWANRVRASGHQVALQSC